MVVQTCGNCAEVSTGSGSLKSFLSLNMVHFSCTSFDRSGLTDNVRT